MSTSAVHYKFKNSRGYSTLTFDGPYISLAELKRQIAEACFGRTDVDFIVTNATTGEDITEDELIQKNSSVLVSRVPIAGATVKKGVKKQVPTQQTAPAQFVDTSSMSEAERLQYLQQKDSDFYAKQKSWKELTGKPHEAYVCHRCGEVGKHYKHECPTLGDPKYDQEIKTATGIPAVMLEPAEGPHEPGAMLQSDGTWVKLKSSEKSRNFHKEAPTSSIPKDLTCPVCDKLLQDAVTAPCCSGVCCDACLRKELIAEENPKCPMCGQKDVNPADIIPNKGVRLAVAKYKDGSRAPTNGAKSNGGNSQHVNQQAMQYQMQNSMQNPAQGMGMGTQFPMRMPYMGMPPNMAMVNPMMMMMNPAMAMMRPNMMMPNWGMRGQVLSREEFERIKRTKQNDRLSPQQKTSRRTPRSRSPSPERRRRRSNSPRRSRRRTRSRSPAKPDTRPQSGKVEGGEEERSPSKVENTNLGQKERQPEGKEKTKDRDSVESRRKKKKEKRRSSDRSRGRSRDRSKESSRKHSRGKSKERIVEDDSRGRPKESSSRRRSRDQDKRRDQDRKERPRSRDGDRDRKERRRSRDGDRDRKERPRSRDGDRDRKERRRSRDRDRDRDHRRRREREPERPKPVNVPRRPESSRRKPISERLSRVQTHV